MTGDRIRNNCCILDYPDGSQVSFMCGSMGSYCHWKEYIEVFGAYTAITVSDFVDMRVRGFEGQYDRLYPPHLNEHADEIRRYGFDFYETYKVSQMCPEKKGRPCDDGEGMFLELVERPIALPFDPFDYEHTNPDLWGFIPDKGWVQSLEHFAECFLNGTEPDNADGNAGTLSTVVALSLLRSLETGQPVEIDQSAHAAGK